MNGEAHTEVERELNGSRTEVERERSHRSWEIFLTRTVGRGWRMVTRCWYGLPFSNTLLLVCYMHMYFHVFIWHILHVTIRSMCSECVERTHSHVYIHVQVQCALITYTCGSHLPPVHFSGSYSTIVWALLPWVASLGPAKGMTIIV